MTPLKQINPSQRQTRPTLTGVLSIPSVWHINQDLLPLFPLCAGPTYKLPDRDFQQTPGSLQRRISGSLPSRPPALSTRLPGHRRTCDQSHQPLGFSGHPAHISSFIWNYDEEHNAWSNTHDSRQPLCYFCSACLDLCHWSFSTNQPKPARRKDNNVEHKNCPLRRLIVSP